jgi:hypothetical protein
LSELLVVGFCRKEIVENELTGEINGTSKFHHKMVETRLIEKTTATMSALRRVFRRCQKPGFLTARTELEAGALISF